MWPATPQQLRSDSGTAGCAQCPLLVCVGGEIMKRIKEGEVVDLVILPSGQIDEPTKLGNLVPGTRVDLAKSGVGVAVRAGAPKPDQHQRRAQARIARGEIDRHFLGQQFRLHGQSRPAHGHCRWIAARTCIGEVTCRLKSV